MEALRSFFVEQEPRMGGIFWRSQQRAERKRGVDFRDRDSPALLAGFQHDALPAVQPRCQPRLRDAHRGIVCFQGEKPLDAELCPLLQDPLESIGFDQRGGKNKLGSRFFRRIDLPDRTYVDLGPAALDGSSVAETRTIEELYLVTHSKPQNCAQVMGLVRRENGNSVPYLFLWDKKSPSGHGHLLPEDILHLLEDVAFVRDLIILVQVRKALEELPLLFGELRRDDNIHSDELIAPPALIQADDAFIA
jgi:hypothetical protein